jgi:hypothetical protein
MAKGSTEITVHTSEMLSATYHLLGTTPLFPRVIGKQAALDLLMGTKKKTSADKAMKIKHDPYAEFRAASILMQDDSQPTLIALPVGAFKKATMASTKVVGGATQVQLGMLLRMDPFNVPVFGPPMIHMTTVRNADMNRTPDIRTRVIMPEWACTIEVTFASPQLTTSVITNLLVNAGIFVGVGDWRQEKGSGSCGSFKIVAENDPDFLRITREYGRAFQVQAMKDPVSADAATEEMLEAYNAELNRRRENKTSETTSKKTATVKGD